jgi:predicted dehydrogenase
MKETRGLRTGIVGCGLIAEKHAAVVRGLRGCRLAAVCDRDIGLASRFARRFDVPGVYVGIDEMLASGTCDAVHITTPPATHAAVARKALEAGCHVLVEKPAAMTLAELDALGTAATRKGVRLAVVHNMLFEPATRQALSVVASGRLGRVVSLHVRDWYPSGDAVLSNPAHWCHRLPGGMFGEMLPHPLYLADALMPGVEPSHVSASRLHPATGLPCDELLVLLSGEGTMAVIGLSLNGPRELFEFDVVCERGVVRASVTDGAVRIETDRGRPSRTALAMRNLSHGARIGLQTLAAGAMTLGRVRRSGHEVVLRDFYRALRSGEGFVVKPERMRSTTMLYERVCAMLPSYVR